MTIPVSGSGTSWIIGSKDFDQSLPGGAVFELRFKVSLDLYSTATNWINTGG